MLYGETEGGLNGVYVLNGNRKVIYGEGGRPIVDQRIELNGDELALDAGAVLDVSGGGNLLATEFISGTTGKRDVLGEDISSGAFAIVPAASLHSAAYDQRIVTEAQFEGGKSIHLSGTADLPAGEYIMLPARYALLPGAYLVRPVSDYQDIGAGESYRSSDGSIVVSGYYTYTGTDLRDSARTSGFAILEGEAVQNKARYTLTNANDFFAPEELAAGNHGFVQRLPRDAGTVAITATESLTLQGSLRAEVEDGGRGAALDIASSAIEVVAGADSAVGGTGALILDAADLSALGAESILLGGVRSENVNGVSIATRSSTVTIAGGAALSAPEVMLAATDTVTVEHDASITAGGAEVRSEDISLNGSGAFVRVATAAAADVRRTNAGNSGRVAIASGATLSAASGSISLETSGDADLSGALAATGGEVSFTGNLISLGNVDPAVSGLVLDAAQLSQLDAATLSLNSRNSIDWYGAVDLDFANLSLSARALRGYDDGTVSIDAAGDVTFRGGDSINDPADSIAAGQLNLTANNVIFDGGAVELSGFDNVALLANRELRAGISGNLDEHAADSATLDVVGGNLQLGAQRVTTASGVDFSVTAAGRATLSGSGATQSLEAVNDLGGSFTLEAGAIELATRIELPSGLVTLNAIDAAQGGITVTGNAAIAVGGLSTEFADSIAHSSGGHVKLDTASGDLLLAEGSSIDVSASGGTNAGSIELTAAAGNLRVAGTLAGSADNGGATGSFSADAQNLGDFAALAQRVNTGGFAGDLNFHQRGVGDLTVASGATVQGTSVSMTADRGSVVVAGSILSHGDDGGRINLAASNGMTVSGTLDARATNAEERNGRIGLNVSSGGLNVTDGAVIATVAAGAAAGTSGDGSVAVRLPQQALLTVIDADSSNDNVRLGGDWSRTRDVSVEGFAVHVDADGILDDNDVIALPGNVIYDQAAAFAARTDAISTALSNAGMPALEVLTGIEIQSGNPDGSLTLDTLADTDWDLSAWRFAAGSGALTRAGVLTLRATGDLTFNDSLSDGFSTLTPESYFKLELGFGDSWSYNLIAGADTASADVMATQSATHAGSVIINGGTDSFSSANYTFVRTGTGSIDVAAAADIVLSNDAAMIYTAGEASDGMIYPIDRRGQGNQLGGLYYPTNGGDITLSAGRDISRRDALFAPQTDQLVSEWLWRIGNVDSPNTRSTAWSVNFDQFHQGVAALAGGDVTASAGGNITDVSVSTTTIGRQQNNIANDRTAAANSLDVIGGGNVSVAAGGDILGGSYYSGRGKLELQAQGEVGESKLNGLAPILLLSDTQAKVTARTGVRIDGVATPTLLPQGVSQGQRESTNSAFSTYSTDSSLAVESTAGDASVVANDSKINEVYGFTGEQADLAFTLLPGTVDALALRGSATVNGTLMPDENGALSVRAYQDVNFDVIVSDVDPNDLPDADRPMTDAFAIADATGGYLALTNWEDARDRLLDVFNAATPVRLQAAQQGRLSASRLVAARGDVTGRGYFGSAVDIHAGDDVVDVDLALQNLVPSDVSTITAGGDIAYTLSRAAGGLAPNDNGIEIDGPGQLLLTAGGNIDLGTSEGVVSQGDEINPVLADTGASITALAGLDGEAPDYAAFGQEYVHHRDAHSEALMDYIEASTGNRPSDAAAARATFAGLGDRQQRVFLQRVLLTEVRASAEEAASADRKDDYSRGFDALETLFPGSTAADNNPYRGDISLFFSRINTLDGGDISLLTPGGGVNVGLAAETLRRFGIDKTPGDLGVVTRRGGQVGIVTDGDVQVNESRIFAINDSDIVVWSSNGDIDAGRGAKTAISAPTSTVTYDLDGHAFVRYDAALSGSGIQARTTTSDFERGAVVLAAPRGIVNASDAGIVAGDLTIAATAVLGADNISVSGLAVGVPVDTGGLGASLAGVAASASSASKAASTAVDDGDSRDQPAASIAEAALSWLDVFVIGLGEEGCKQDDLECLKRQSPAL
ncbi:MAG: filamentous hemagglutinin family protein [Pseudomonadota bacterium]|nr:filamentous hemagglutinin family protein [Pseudomonadota bacterium]